MDWPMAVISVALLAAGPALWVLAYLRRRRSRALTVHNTTPPASDVTTGQLR